MSKILALLVCTLCGSGERCELAIDLQEKFAEFAKIKRSGVVFVVGLKELVEASQVMCGLREPSSYLLANSVHSLNVRSIVSGSLPFSHVRVRRNVTR